MNFFEHQQRARQRTSLLTMLFILATVATVLLTNAVVLIVVAVLTAPKIAIASSFSPWIAAHPKAICWTTLGTLGFIGGASMFRMASLNAGGGAVARSVGGVLVTADTTDNQKRELLNVVEEMAIAAGIPVPQVYVLEQEPGINAFAAGFTTSDAAIAVTRGALELLTRDELQGVIAHEFSHILNGDMRLNTRLMGMLFGILVIGLSGRLIIRGLSQVRVSSSRGGGSWLAGAFLAGLALIVIGYTGTLFASMIRAAVSRQRECLADASAVQFTRNPAGIAGALKKIAASPLRAVLQSTDSEEVSHMLLADGRKMFESFFATHPPILERIKLLDNSFTPAELERIKLPPVTIAAASKASALPISPSLVVSAIGNPNTSTPVRAMNIVIPDSLRRMAYSRQHASSLVLALALSRDPAVRARQIALLHQRLPENLLPHLDAVIAMIESLAPSLRLPLTEIAFPTLRQHSSADLQTLVTAIEEMTRMDGQFDYLDYALVRLLRQRLTEAAAPQSVHGVFTPKLHNLRDEIGVLFGVMAQAGARDKFIAHRAYDAGVNQLLSNNAPPFIQRSPWIAPLDRALVQLDGLAPLDKQTLIEALVVTIQNDGQIRLGELELLRTISAILHCPVPPLAASVASENDVSAA